MSLLFKRAPVFSVSGWNHEGKARVVLALDKTCASSNLLNGFKNDYGLKENCTLKSSLSYLKEHLK